MLAVEMKNTVLACHTRVFEAPSRLFPSSLIVVRELFLLLPVRIWSETATCSILYDCV